MAFAQLLAAGDLTAHGYLGWHGGENTAKVAVEIGSSLSLSMNPAEARKLSADLLTAAAQAETIAAGTIKGNAGIAHTGQVAV